jgi:hypothetical protein
MSDSFVDCSIIFALFIFTQKLRIRNLDFLSACPIWQRGQYLTYFFLLDMLVLSQTDFLIFGRDLVLQANDLLILLVGCIFKLFNTLVSCLEFILNGRRERYRKKGGGMSGCLRGSGWITA